MEMSSLMRSRVVDVPELKISTGSLIAFLASSSTGSPATLSRPQQMAADEVPTAGYLVPFAIVVWVRLGFNPEG